MITFKQFIFEKILFKNKKVKAKFSDEITNLKAVINPSLTEISEDDFSEARGLIRMNGDLILVTSRRDLIHIDIFRVLSIVFSDVHRMSMNSPSSFEDIEKIGGLPIQREFITNRIYLGESIAISVRSDERITELLKKAKKLNSSFKFIQKKIL